MCVQRGVSPGANASPARALALRSTDKNRSTCGATASKTTRGAEASFKHTRRRDRRMLRPLARERPNRGAEGKEGNRRSEYRARYNTRGIQHVDVGYKGGVRNTTKYKFPRLNTTVCEPFASTCIVHVRVLPSFQQSIFVEQTNTQ